jgi:phosphoenolpyruvate synthase/pyruvate phosphate dikinase
MIYDLLDIERVEALRVGSLVNDLSRLAVSGIQTVATALFSTASFDEWLQQGSVNDSEIDQLLAWAQSDSTQTSKLMIRTSLRQIYHGLRDKVVTDGNFSAARSAIEGIYRSWGDERARASRLILGVDEALSKPVLVVQPFFSRVYSVITRHSVTGSLTSNSNYTDNINNQLPEFSRDVDHLIRSCDQLLGRPVKVHFTADDSIRNLAVLSVSEEIMTMESRWQALSDLLDRGIIDQLQFLRTITPDMIGFQSGSEINLDDASGYVQGIPASAGIARGRLVFPGARLLHKVHLGRLVFLAGEISPEDVPLLTECVAAVELGGGLTSHSAVMCRGMRAPAVVRCGGRLDLRSRTYETPKGQEIPEFGAALVDGNEGIAAFGNVGMQPHWVRNRQSNELASVIMRCLQAFPPDTFRTLPTDMQWHISELKNRLRALGLIQ